MLAIDPYAPRRTGPLGVVDWNGWTIKLVGITAIADLPDPWEASAAIDIAARHLPPPAGHAFLIVHRGNEALWAILGWWRLDILYHRTFRADLGTTDFVEVTVEGPTACVWELAAIEHERQTWITHVLSRPADPDYPGYLATTLTVASERA